jgi:hypothetical protein
MESHVARIGEMRNACLILVGKVEEKKEPLGRHRYRWNDDIKMDPTEKGVRICTEPLGL